MAEYIEREAVFSAIWKTSAEHDVFFPAIILDAIKSIPAADVRPVVLCRDCKYNKGIKTWIDNDLTADCTNGYGYPPLDWYCADGAKREES